MSQVIFDLMGKRVYREKSHSIFGIGGGVRIFILDTGIEVENRWLWKTSNIQTNDLDLAKRIWGDLGEEGFEYTINFSAVIYTLPFYKHQKHHEPQIQRKIKQQLNTNLSLTSL